MQRGEILRIILLHSFMVDLAQLSLHLSVYYTGPNGYRCNIWLFDRQSKREMVKRSFRRSVCAPCAERMDCGAGGSEDDAAFGPS